MQGDNSEKSQGFRENKRRRTQSKFNKQVPRYECFCSKQYLSYPALYLHLKNKHNQYFQCSKNGKRVETTKLTQSFDSAEGYKVFKISFDPTLNPAENQKKDNLNNNGKQFQNSFPQNQLFFQAGNYMPYPYQPYFDYMVPNMNDYNRKIYPKDVAIQSAFEMFMQNQTDRGVKQKLEIQLFLALLIQCLNQNYYVLKDERVGDKECRRYTAQYNSKLLSEIFPFFEEYFLANIRKEVENKGQYFFVRYSTIMSTANYKKIFQQLLQFINSQKQEIPTDKITQNKILSYPSIDREQNMEYDQVDEEELDSQPQNSDQPQQKEFHAVNRVATAINVPVQQNSRSNAHSSPNQASEPAGADSKASFKPSKP